MIEAKFISKLKTVGLELHDDFVILRGKKDFRKEKITAIREIKLVETDDEDHSGFLGHFFNSFNRFNGNHSSAAPSKIYRLYIIKKDGEDFFRKAHSFDLIGVKKAVEKLNEALQKKT